MAFMVFLLLSATVHAEAIEYAFTPVVFDTEQFFTISGPTINENGDVAFLARQLKPESDTIFISSASTSRWHTSR